MSRPQQVVANWRYWQPGTLYCLWFTQIQIQIHMISLREVQASLFLSLSRRNHLLRNSPVNPQKSPKSPVNSWKTQPNLWKTQVWPNGPKICARRTKTIFKDRAEVPTHTGRPRGVLKSVPRCRLGWVQGPHTALWGHHPLLHPWPGFKADICRTLIIIITTCSYKPQLVF